MDFVTAVKTCLRKYATFSGRASRSEFWYWVLFAWVGSILCSVVDYAVFGAPDFSNMESYPAATVSQAFALLTALPALAVGSRRLHDTGRSGWWQVLMITVIGLIPLFIWWASKSHADNKYGAGPEQPTAQPSV